MEMVEEILSHQQHPQSFMKNAAVGWRDELPKKIHFCGNKFISYACFELIQVTNQPKSTRQ